jgi:hypothetical protein
VVPQRKFMERQGESVMTDIILPEQEEEVATFFTFFRLCVDLRSLNSKTVPDIFQLPRINDLLKSIPSGFGRYSI